MKQLYRQIKATKLRQLNNCLKVVDKVKKMHSKRHIKKYIGNNNYQQPLPNKALCDYARQRAIVNGSIYGACKDLLGMRDSVKMKFIAHLMRQGTVCEDNFSGTPWNFFDVWTFGDRVTLSMFMHKLQSREFAYSVVGNVYRCGGLDEEYYGKTMIGFDLKALKSIYKLERKVFEVYGGIDCDKKREAMELIDKSNRLMEKLIKKSTYLVVTGGPMPPVLHAEQLKEMLNSLVTELVGVRDNHANDERFALKA